MWDGDSSDDTDSDYSSCSSDESEDAEGPGPADGNGDRIGSMSLLEALADEDNDELVRLKAQRDRLGLAGSSVTKGAWRNGKALSPDLRYCVLRTWYANEKLPINERLSAKQIAVLYDISTSSIYQWRKDFEEEGRLEARTRGGSKATVLTESALYWIGHVIKVKQFQQADPAYQNAQQICEAVSAVTEGEINLTPDQVRNLMLEYRVCTCVCILQFCISIIHIS